LWVGETGKLWKLPLSTIILCFSVENYRTISVYLMARPWGDMRQLSWLLSKMALLIYADEWATVQRELRLVKLKLENVKESGRPPYILQMMLVSGEDHRFYSHCGIDPIAVCRAIWRTTLCGRREGASTIEMQLIRVLTAQYQRSISRKCREALLAVLLNRTVPKTDIASFYLYVAYYGTDLQGFSHAARKLHILPDAMSLREAASLTARLKYPEPRKMLDRRRNQIDIRTDYLISRYNRYFKKEEIEESSQQESHATI
jgi:membrane peptidoglycan carboxypeptidase